MTIHECNSCGEFIEFYDWTGNRRLKCICQSGWQARPITGHRLPGYMSRLCDDSHKIDLFEAAHSNRNFSLVTDCIMPLVFVYNTKTLPLSVYRISFLDVLYPVSYPLPINDIFWFVLRNVTYFQWHWYLTASEWSDMFKLMLQIFEMVLCGPAIKR